jgi:peptidoglycan/LPS O-acetylase OafA/YrhL
VTLGVVLLFAAIGATLIAMGRTDRGQGRLVAVLMQIWGAGLILAAIVGFVAGPEQELPVVVAGAWFLGGVPVVIGGELVTAIASRRTR